MERLAVPAFEVPDVATNAVMFVAFAIAPEETTKISLVTRSVIESVPESTLNVSAPPLPVRLSFPVPPVIISAPA